MPKHDDAPFQVVEFFAGVGRIAGVSNHCVFSAAAVDINYGCAKPGKRPPMDINSDAGLTFPTCNIPSNLHPWFKNHQSKEHLMLRHELLETCWNFH